MVPKEVSLKNQACRQGNDLLQKFTKDSIVFASPKSDVKGDMNITARAVKRCYQTNQRMQYLSGTARTYAANKWLHESRAAAQFSLKLRRGGGFPVASLGKQLRNGMQNHTCLHRRTGVRARGENSVYRQPKGGD